MHTRRQTDRASEDHARRWTRLPKHIYKIVSKTPGSVLLETSRFDSSNRYSYLFQKPVEIILAKEFDEVPRVFVQIDEALAKGCYVAGFISYECGYYFENSFRALADPVEWPLVWFGVYDKPLIFDHAVGRFEPGEPSLSYPEAIESIADGIVNEISLDIGEDEYRANILQIKEYIAAGETYQVNFTNRVLFGTDRATSVVFESLLKNQSIAYGALMNVMDCHILSLSPELFFRTDGRRIETRPMKGTRRRGLDANEDVQEAAWLQRDEKNRSEHVMIVDLLRNDLGRICKTGSVQVEDLFSVEKYETLLQMTSTVSGTLRPNIGYYDIFRSMFPSGSITGAPKIRTMQIIRELERAPRGIAMGSIGFISPHGASAFNVAIRTLVIKDGRAQMGVGGGIVADSQPEDEYRECLLKASFLTRKHQDFQLIETLLWEKEYCFLNLHVDRLESSAGYFNFFFDREAVLSQLCRSSESFASNRRYRVRLLLSADGDVTAQSAEIFAYTATARVRLSEECTSSTDVFVRHKTTRREFYDRQYAKARADGYDEVIFGNEKGQITEGAISNLFVEREGLLLTPPLSCGLLAGVFRRHLLESCARAKERILTVDDLRTADAVYLCNSVRGMRRVESLCLDALPVRGARVRAE